MTDSDDFAATRPISVAELLAKNGTIGAPPVGGRRRRRRGNSDAVTVAELTGEIPIIRPEALQTEPAAEAEQAAPEAEPAAEPEAQAAAQAPEEPAAEVAEPEPAAAATDGAEAMSVDAEVASGDAEVPPVAEVAPVHTEAESDYEAHLRQREAEADPLEFVAPTRKPAFRWSFKPVRVAEEMVPDPVVDDDLLADTDTDSDADLRALEGVEPVAKLDTGVIPVVADTETFEADGPRGDTVPASPRETSRTGRSASYDTLFGGFAADEDTRRVDAESDADVDHDYAADAELEEGGSGLKRGAWVVGQSLLAVAFGAGMFFAFDQLWRWNQIVALMLSMLVILGLVAGIRVIRKDHDLASTLIAILVGGLVTFGPLALLYSA
ncbi:MAG: hypothetical protein P4L86_01410 [Mycobacterium sp.]|nr:hypothetical protein [Mycobacterium sp.]